LGIGTASPKAKFVVVGSGAFTGSMSGNTILVQSGGYVRGRLAIGKTGALTALDVVGTISGSALTLLNPGGINNVIGNSVLGGTLSSVSKGRLTVYGSGAFTKSMSGNTLFVQSGGYILGNFGVGTNAPVQQLHVVGQCVTGDTELSLVSNGRVSTTQIKDIHGGEQVQTLDEATGRLTTARIKGLLDKGVQPVFKITTEGGRTIRTTGNHPYLVEGYHPHAVTAVEELGFQPVGDLIGDASKRPGTTWVKVAGLKAGDRIAVASAIM
ncbi:hypothetical protein HYR82_00005, partial [Candidatus Peregrinibacteria bacterium]|nr:hypothetical protein [Candidatus Peregrinibacteria bacterium]